MADEALKDAVSMRGKPPKAVKPPPGRPPKHGSRALARFVRQNKLDGRTWLSRFIEQTEGVIAEDQGGLDHLTRRESMLVTMAANLWVEWQLTQWQRQKASLQGQVMHESDKFYLAQVNSLRRVLESLGLRPPKVERRLLSIEDFWADAEKDKRPQRTPESATGSQGHDHTAGKPKGKPPVRGGGTEAEGA